MDITDSIINYRRFLKRKNCAKGTIKNYMNSLKNFAIWIDLPIEEVTNQNIQAYIDSLLDKRLRPKTINNNLDSIRGFYNYLQNEEKAVNSNPVKKGYCLRLSRPLPKHLRDEQAQEIFKFIKSIRDRAIFRLMLRCGLRVEEVADLTLSAIDLKRGQILIFKGKGSKGRIVYFSKDTYDALIAYIKARKSLRTQGLFLVEKGTCKGKGISVRGIQKRIEYYSKKSRIKVSCHHLRHTMATQLLNAGADLEIIQDLLGHSKITTTQRYCKVSNLRVQREYHKAMEYVLQR
ncbi:MAG: tyrosine-type recombinase/integrase [Deltaproteobacteria bacterium]|uniref:tyrosine-type recombinase/integrase n=1 Tax=Desulfobacula sp. TaxID=2593537 RepID=UPI00198F93D1|nr:tyrosine-type recombinase/integrase [Candidatus Desulfobacula maris]MBL6996124.1 tyrosine-type recombinase/integrase [Desulfobacula sp.]